MRKKDDIETIRNVMIAMLYIPFKMNKDSIIPIKNNNPIIETFFQYQNQIINLSDENEENIKKAIAHYKELINRSDIDALFIHVKKPCRLMVFDTVKDYLGIDSYNRILSEVYKSIEFPNHDNDVDSLIENFKKIDKSKFMDKKSMAFYNSLPDKITIYRGIYSDEYESAVSWTTEYETAKWFANRFNEGFIVKGTTAKEHVFCCYASESEVVVDPEHIQIQNIESAQTESMDFKM